MAVYDGNPVTFERTITAVFNIAATPTTVSVVLAKFGFWGVGNYSITAIVSRAVRVGTPA